MLRPRHRRAPCVIVYRALFFSIRQPSNGRSSNHHILIVTFSISSPKWGYRQVGYMRMRLEKSDARSSCATHAQRATTALVRLLACTDNGRACHDWPWSLRLGLSQGTNINWPWPLHLGASQGENIKTCSCYAISIALAGNIIPVRTLMLIPNGFYIPC